MLSKPLKKFFSPLLENLAEFFIFSNIKPETVSLIALVFALGTFFSVVSLQIVLAPFFFGLALIFLHVSKREAKKTKSLFGNYFYSLSAKYSEALVYLAFVFFYPIASFFVITFSLLAEYAKSRLSLVVKFPEKWPKTGEQADRVTIAFGGLVLPVFFPRIFGFEPMELALYIITFISIAGFVQSFLFAKKIIGEK